MKTITSLKAIRVTTGVMGAIVLSSTLFFSYCSAGETVRPAGPIGGSDMRAALLPPVGFYAGAVYVDADILKLNSQGARYDVDGRMQLGAAIMAYVYKEKLWGGTLGSTLSVPFQKLCAEVSGVLEEECSYGLNNIYTDVIMWSKNLSPERQVGPYPFGLTTMLGLGLTLPTGTYDKRQRVNNRANFWTVTPNVALTYTMPSLLGSSLGDATELSGRMFLNMYTTNKATDYSSGNLWDFESAITQRKGTWQAGLFFSKFGQYQDDEIGGERLADGNRATQITWGPVIAKDFITNGKIMSVKAKLGLTRGTENAFDTRSFTVVFVSSF